MYYRGQRLLLKKIHERYQKRISLHRETDFTTPKFKEVEFVPSDRKTLFYYYKRWIWIMFPWVCISVNLNFSQIIEACYKSATEYMSVKAEHEYTQRKALIIDHLLTIHTQRRSRSQLRLS